MKKVSRKYTILILGIAIYLVSLAGCSISGESLIDFNGSAQKADMTEQASIENISKIEIKSVSADIDIVSGGSEVSAHLYGNYYSKSELTLVCEVDDNTLKIYVDRPDKKITDFGISKLQLDIIIPSQYAKSIKVSSTSGKIDINTQNQYEKTLLQTVSGDINAKDITGTINVNSVSGDIMLRDLSSQVTALNVAGKLDFTFNQIAKCIAGTTSGDITIYAPSDSSFDLHCFTTSGVIDNEFDLSEMKSSEKSLSGNVGAGGTKVDANSVSGDISIHVD